MGRDRGSLGAADGADATETEVKADAADTKVEGADATLPETTAPAVTEDAAVEEAAPAEPVDPVDAAIAAWWRKVGRNSPLSRNTAAYNYVSGSLPLLKSLLKGETE